MPFKLTEEQKKELEKYVSAGGASAASLALANALDKNPEKLIRGLVENIHHHPLSKAKEKVDEAIANVRPDKLSDVRGNLSEGFLSRVRLDDRTKPIGITETKLPNGTVIEDVYDFESRRGIMSLVDPTKHQKRSITARNNPTNIFPEAELASRSDLKKSSAWNTLGYIQYQGGDFDNRPGISVMKSIQDLPGEKSTMETLFGQMYKNRPYIPMRQATPFSDKGERFNKIFFKNLAKKAKPYLKAASTALKSVPFLSFGAAALSSEDPSDLLDVPSTGDKSLERKQVEDPSVRNTRKFGPPGKFKKPIPKKRPKSIQELNDLANSMPSARRR